MGKPAEAARLKLDELWGPQVYMSKIGCVRIDESIGLVPGGLIRMPEGDRLVPVFRHEPVEVLGCVAGWISEEA